MIITRKSHVTNLEYDLNLPITKNEYEDLLFNQNSSVWKRLTPEEVDYVELSIIPEDIIDRFKE